MAFQHSVLDVSCTATYSPKGPSTLIVIKLRCLGPKKYINILFYNLGICTRRSDVHGTFLGTRTSVTPCSPLEIFVFV